MAGLVRNMVAAGGKFRISGIRVIGSRTYSSTAKEITVRDALNTALDEEMSADPRVFVMGEEVGKYQGAYKITKGLLEKRGPDRVIDTPITEAGFTGIGVGAAYSGLKAIDHIINSAAKSNYMSAGQISVPIVFRGPNGAASGVRAQHSQAAEILEKEEISAEVINLRSIGPLDRATINDSVKKTSRLATLGFPLHSGSAEICAVGAAESLVPSLSLALFWHINSGIRDILADYVHHEITRNWILIYLRLFLLIVIKDIVLSLV